METFADYIEGEMTKNEAIVDEAFRALMRLVADANKDEAIRLWVEGSIASRRFGWYQNEKSREKVEA